MTRYILTSLALAGLATGCRPKATIDDFRAGVPRQETVTDDVPSKAAGQALTVEAHQAALQGAPADYWVATVAVSTVINGGAFFVGALVKTIISLPPTSLKDDV